MSSFCGPQSIPATGYTVTELQAVWPNINNAILPSTLPQLTNGKASQEFLTSYVSGLVSSGKLPNNPEPTTIKTSTFNAPDVPKPLADFISKETEFINNVKQEYCFYESRYFSALDSLLTILADTANITNTTTVINSKLIIVRTLNDKLNVLSQIVNEISKYRGNSSTQVQAQITELNSKFIQTGNNLAAQNALLNSETAAADLHKRMIEYTVEKNKAHQNLLSLFAVLNVTALAMLFYVARS